MNNDGSVINAWRSGYDGGYFVEGYPGEVVAEIPTDGISDKIASGRSRLIAAAPEMLMALELVMASGCPPSAAKAVSIALKKAKRPTQSPE